MQECKIPPPQYTLIETSRGDDPAIVVVNSALRMFDQRQRFAWHLSVTVTCKNLGQGGMPTSEEGLVLYQLEDLISESLLKGDNAVFLARVTCRGHRELAYRVGDPEIANTALQRLVSAPFALREWEYRLEYDEPWELAKPELQLLEKDSTYN